MLQGMTEMQPLTQLAIARLKKLAEGNLIDPNKIELVESKETTYHLQATLRLTPSIEVQVKKRYGRPKNKNHRLLPSIEALTQEIEQQREDLQKSNKWLDAAYKELEKTPSHGWGQDGATLFWDKDKSILAAHDPCPTCNGTAQSPCHACQGIGTVHCYHCEGRFMELCPLCHGTGRDPAYPENKCPQCFGEKQIHCRFCNSTGRMPCEQCQGRGYQPCPDCKGTGYLSQLAQLKKCATIAFNLGQTQQIPSGLLRLIQRIGKDDLYKHADISMSRDDADPLIIKLTAQIPYADIKLKLNDKACMISMFGKNNRMAGVPLFLDAALESTVALLKALAKGHGKIDPILKARMMHNALSLTLQGKKHPNELRRLYPVGLSAKIAKEIMTNMSLAVRNITRKTRIIVGSIFTLLAIGVFAGLFLTPLYAQMTTGWNPFLLYTVLALLPIITIGKCAVLLLYSSHHVLQKNFKKIKIGKTQPLGRAGYSLFAMIAASYLLILYFAGILSW